MALSRVPQLKLPEKERERLASRLDDLIRDETRHRSNFVTKAREWVRQYESVHRGEASFPWPKSANPKVGVTQYVVDTMFSVFVNVMRANRKPWFVETDDPEIASMTHDIETVMASLASSENELNHRARVEPAQMECCQIGSGVVKAVWSIERERVRYFANVPSDKLKANFEAAKKNGRVAASDILKGVDVTVETLEIVERDEIRQGPKLYHVSLLDFWYPLGYQEIQDMPWVAERYRILSDEELDEIGEDMDWDPEDVEKVKRYWENLTQDREDQEETDRATGLESGDIEAYTFFEFWMKWRFEKDPLTGESKPPVKKWVFTFHPASKTLLCAIPHPNNNGIWPFFDYHYWRRVGKWLSRGICPTLESDEKEINTIHKQRRDAATAANTVIGKARTDSGINEDNAEVWPMKMFFMEDTEKDLVFGNIGRELNIQSLIQEEQWVDQIVQKKTGLTDFNLGKDMGQVAKGRGPARNFMAQIRENLRRMSLVLGNWRRTEEQLGMHVLELIQQHAPFGKVFSILGEGGERLEKFFLLPQGPIRGRLKLRCTATDEVLNEEIRRESTLLVQNLLQAYYKQIGEMVALLSNPNAPPDAKALASAVAAKSTVMMREVLENFHVRQPERFLVDTPTSFSDLSEESQVTIVTQMVNALKGKGVPIALVDTRQAPLPPTPPAGPEQPPPIPPAPPQGAAPPARGAPPIS